MPPDFELVHVLQRHGVPFVVIGGHAVNAYGHRRATEDVDVIWQRSPESERALHAALSEVEAVRFGREIDPNTGIERTYPVTPGWISVNHMMVLWTRLGLLDLFDFIPGFPNEDPAQVFTSSTNVGSIRYVSLDWLRRMKKASGRPIDLLDLEKLPE